jgi:hypothetical protein
MATTSPNRVIIDSGLYKRLQLLCKKKPLKYPHVKFVVNQMIQKELEENNL